MKKISAYEKIKANIGKTKLSICGNAKRQIEEAMNTLKAQERNEIGAIPKDLTFVSGELFDDYIHDMKIIQRFAVLNRKAMTEVILNGMGLTLEFFRAAWSRTADEPYGGVQSAFYGRICR